MTLGLKVYDPITNAEGIVAGRSEFLYGSPEIFVLPTTIENGQPQGGRWYPEGRWEPLEKRPKKVGL